MYDCSVFPARRAHGGLRNGQYSPYLIATPSVTLVEFPMTVNEVVKTPVCFFGGGYLRLFPLSLIQRMAHSVLRQGRPVIFYVHPREVDPAQPRLDMNRWRRFKSYVNLDTTEAKLRASCGRLSSRLSNAWCRMRLPGFCRRNRAGRKPYEH